MPNWAIDFGLMDLQNKAGADMADASTNLKEAPKLQRNLKSKKCMGL